MLSESHLVAGTVSIWREGWTEGLAHIETAVGSFSPGETSSQFRVGPRPEVVSHALAGLVQWQVGFPDRAVAESARALELAAELAHPYSIAYALFHAGLLDLWRGDWTAVAARADELEGVADAHDYAVWRALAMVLRGTAMVGREDSNAGLAEVGRGFSLYHGLSTPPIFWPSMLVVRAQAFGMAGRREEALACLQEAQECVGDDDPLSADVAIMQGDLLMGAPSPDLAAAEALFEKAASIAIRAGGPHHRARSGDPAPRAGAGVGTGAARTCATLAGSSTPSPRVSARHRWSPPAPRSNGATEAVTVRYQCR